MQVVPDCHLLKLETIEYGYGVELEIRKGFFEVEYREKATVPLPRIAGSWYHWSKAHDSNITFACRLS